MWVCLVDRLTLFSYFPFPTWNFVIYFTIFLRIWTLFMGVDLNQKSRAHSTELQNSNPFPETVYNPMGKTDNMPHRLITKQTGIHTWCANYYLYKGVRKWVKNHLASDRRLGNADFEVNLKGDRGRRPLKWWHHRPKKVRNRGVTYLVY